MSKEIEFIRTGLPSPFLFLDAPYTLLQLREYVERLTADVGHITDLAGYLPHEWLAQLSPTADIYAITSMTPNAWDVIPFIDQIKRTRPDAIVVVGGVDPTIRPELYDNHADIVFMGPGTDSLVRWLNGEIVPVNNRILGLSEDLSKSPSPLFKLSDLPNVDQYGRYLLPKDGSKVKTLGLYCSKGCPYTCIYCLSGDPNVGVQYYPVDSIKAQMRDYQDHNFEGIRFWDDNAFVFNKPYYREIFNYLTQNQIHFCFYSRADTIHLIDEDVLNSPLLSYISIGVESGSQNSLSTIGKRLQLEKVDQAIDFLKRHNVPVDMLLMIGPWDNEQTIDETAQKLRIWQPEMTRVALTIPFPGTELGRNPLKYGFAKPYKEGIQSYKNSRTGVLVGKQPSMLYPDPEKYDGFYRQLHEAGLEFRRTIFENPETPYDIDAWEHSREQVALNV